MLCRLLDVTRSGYYAWQQGSTGDRAPYSGVASAAVAKLVVQIQRIYLASHKTAGYRKVYASLKQNGVECSEDRVKKLMRQHSLKARGVLKYKPQTTKVDISERAYPNLLEQNFSVDAKGRVWVADITYIRMGFKWTYLAVVLDLYNREPVGWAYGFHPDAALVARALEMAIAREQPEPGLIHHSDRGCQYTSHAYRSLLDKYHMRGSMSRKGNPYDNAVMESFFRSLKTEWTNHMIYRTMQEAYKSLYAYIEVFYKYQRLHAALGYLTPKSYEKLRQSRLLAI
jgi:transposase InsO family protein